MTLSCYLSEWNPEAMAYWEDEWQRRRRQSHLRRTQRTAPEKWQIFYDRIADTWDEMTGLSGQVGDAVARLILERRLVTAGDAVLDLGCGPGALALALAARGVAVTAVDSSDGMIRNLEEQIRKSETSGIHPRAADWRTLSMEPQHHLTAASFFPDACSPEGLFRMESLASRYGLLILGDGKDAFPLRRAIWEKVMEEPCPDGAFHFSCAENYLRAAGRRPETERLTLAARLDADADRVRSFYREYFAIFGKTGPRLERAIGDAISGCTIDGRVQLAGTTTLAVLWWKPRPDLPILTGEDR